MEKINVAELLKDCPKGMKLNCTLFEDVELDCIIDGNKWPIRLIIKDGERGDAPLSLTKEGFYSTSHNPKCVIFPKGKTSWEGFQRPFVNGDIVATNAGEWIGIMEKEEQCGKLMSVHCVLRGDNGLEIYHEKKRQWCFDRLATEKEKQRLFNALRENNYEWNSKEKCLEPLVIKPKFKIRDEVKFSHDGSIFIITAVNDKYYCLAEKRSTITFPALISSDKDWELIPKKFDINTLIPFESKVLVRSMINDTWKPATFGCITEKCSSPFVTVGGVSWVQCIPYKGNEHLLSKTDDCDDYYKTWGD